MHNRHSARPGGTAHRVHRCRYGRAIDTCSRVPETLSACGQTRWADVTSFGRQAAVESRVRPRTPWRRWYRSLWSPALAWPGFRQATPLWQLRGVPARHRRHHHFLR